MTIDDGHDVTALQCSLPDRDRQISTYLAEALPADQAEVFERHYFECDECWREVQQGLEIRAARAAGGHASARQPVSASRRRPAAWPWLAAAASVVLMVSVWQLNRVQPGETPVATPAVPGGPLVSGAPTVTTTPSGPTRQTSTPAPGTTPVLRSPSDSGLKPAAIRRLNGDVRLTWTSVRRAARYAVTINAADGTSVFSRETAATALTIPASVLAPHTGAQLVARVDAINALGVTLATSGPIVLPTRK
jgi:anti-sigma factor RsiW